MADKISSGAPIRLQRKRVRGWRKPEGAVIVDRTSRWGNPYTVEVWGRAGAVERFRAVLERPNREPRPEVRARMTWIGGHVGELRGRDLVCWCAPGQACHADMLLELANGGGR